MNKLTSINPELESALKDVTLEKGLRGQIESLRKMTELTGQVYELQLTNLKIWPLVVLNMAKNEVRLDTDKKEVLFIVTPKTKGKRPPDLKKRCFYLDGAVRMLLGRDWLVVVQIGKKQIYRGEKDERPVADFSSPFPI